MAERGGKRLMDAVKFLKERDRMCRACKACEDCELHAKRCCEEATEAQMIEAVTIVEKWSKEHPAKTRMSEFLKQYPNAPLRHDGMPFASPCNLDKLYYERECSDNCDECRKKYWLEKIE